MLDGQHLPLITVVIPTYNRGSTIGRALRSVLTQDYPELEILVVDDGSTDNTDGVLRSIADPRIRVIRHDHNRGAAAARNSGIAAARGACLALLDSDDEWLPGKLREQVAFMAANDVALATTGYLLQRQHADGRIAERLCLPRDCRSIGRLVWSCDLSIGSTLMAKTETLRRIGPFDAQMRRFEDWDWLLSFTGDPAVTVLKSPLARVHVGRWPPPETVRQCAARLLSRRGAKVCRAGWRAYQKFRAGLLVEQSVAQFHAGKRGRATLLLAASLLRWPIRNFTFYRNLFGLVFGRRIDHRFSRTSPGPVMHVITGLGTGGAETTLWRLLAGDTRGSGEAVVISLTRGGVNAERLRADGIEVIELGMTRGRPSLWATLKLARLIRAYRPRAVQTWMYHADLMGLVALFASGRRGKTPIYWGIRCSDMDLARYHWTLRAVVKVCARLSRLPDGIVANSHAGTEVHHRLGYRPRQMTVVSNGIDAAHLVTAPCTRQRTRRALGIPESAVVTIHVARVDPMKDHPLFIEALSRLPDIVGIAVGRDTQELPPLPNLQCLGERKDIPDLLAAADIFVSTSAFGEGFSNAIAEAMAAGLAVVTTRVGDAEHLVGAAGIVVAPRDADALAAALRRVAGDEALRRSLGEAARRRINERFSLARCVRAFAPLYEGRMPGADQAA